MTPQYLKLWTRQGVAFDLAGALRAARAQPRVSFALQVREAKSEQGLPIWIHAQHLTAPQINRARRRVKRKAARNGRTPRAQTLWLSEWVLVLTTLPPAELSAKAVLELYRVRWQVGVSSQGSITQSVQVRPRLIDSGLVAGEAPGRESKPVKPSDSALGKESMQRSRLQRTVNAEVASLHATPVAEPVYYVRRQQGPGEKSLPRRSSPAGYQRRHGAKGDRATGEVRGVRRRKLAAEAWPITVRGKWSGWHPDGGSGCSTGELRAAKRAGREGPGPVGIPLGKGRQG